MYIPVRQLSALAMMNSPVKISPILRWVLSGTCGLLIGALTLNAQDLTFQHFDRNSDNLIQRDEFKAAFFNNYWNEGTDPDRAGLKNQSLFSFTFALSDADQDDQLSQDEWNDAFDDYYKGYLENNFDAYDGNHDQFISFEEYRAAIQDPDYFRFWDEDADPVITEDELAERVFDCWDINSDGVLTPAEFRTLKSAGRVRSP